MNENLPMYSRLGEVVDHVNNPEVKAVLVKAPPGAGKTILTPQALLQCGYRVIVTEPRKLAVRTVVPYLAKETGTEMGGLFGYHTGDLDDHYESEETRCMFVTDSFAYVTKHIDRWNNGSGDLVLIIDEVPEWNLGIELLTAQLEECAAKGIKVVLMSATLETETLCEFLGGEKVAPIVEVTCRQFPIEIRKPTGLLEEEVVKLVEEFEPLPGDRKILVFIPGKREIADYMQKVQVGLNSKNLQAVLLPLHADLERKEQEECFVANEIPTIVFTTNIAELALTVPGVRAVISSGVCKVMKFINGVNHLVPEPLTKANTEQQKGRAGREEWLDENGNLVKNAIYIDLCELPYEQRVEVPTPAILCSDLKSSMLQALTVGFDLRTKKLFHQPDPDQIRQAEQALINLGCLDSDGNITKKGRMLAKLPLEIELGCILYEAFERGIVDPILDCLSVVQAGGIAKRSSDKTGWVDWTGNESSSDILAQGKVFAKLRAERMSYKDMREAGLSSDAYRDAYGIRCKLARALIAYREWGGDGNFNHRYSTRELEDICFGGDFENDRHDILCSIAAGLVNRVFAFSHRDRWQNMFFKLVGDVDSTDMGRQLAQGTVISMFSEGRLVVGLPFDFSYMKTDRNGFGCLVERYVISWPTMISPDILAEVVPPEMLQQEVAASSVQYDEDVDECMQGKRTWYRGALIGDTTEPCPDHLEAPSLFAKWIARTILYNETLHVNLHERMTELETVFTANYEYLQLVRKYNGMSGQVQVLLFGKDPVNIYFEEILTWVTPLLKGAVSVVDFFEKGGQAEDLRFPMNQDLAQRIQDEFPDHVEFAGMRASVRYNHAELPTVTFGQVALDNLLFLDLPDTGLYLPGDRQVKVAIECQPVAAIDPAVHTKLKNGTDILELKKLCAQYLNASVWQAAQANLPVLEVPTMEGNEPIPEIVVYEYGACELTGEKLVAYGVIRIQENWSRWVGGNRLEVHWTNDHLEAEVDHAYAVQTLPGFRRRAAEDKEFELRMEQQRLTRQNSLKAQEAAREAVKQNRQEASQQKVDKLTPRWQEAERLAEELHFVLGVLTTHQIACHCKQPITDHLEKYDGRLQPGVRELPQARWGRAVPTVPGQLNFNKPIEVDKWINESTALLPGAYQVIAGNVEALEDAQFNLLEVIDPLPDGQLKADALNALTKFEGLPKMLHANKEAERMFQKVKDLTGEITAGGRQLRTAYQACIAAKNPPTPVATAEEASV